MLNTSSSLVLFFGFVIGLSIILQCFVPLTALLFQEIGYSGFWATVFNVNFNLPIDVIINSWAILCAVYVGVDRASLTALTLAGEKGKMEIGNPEHLKQVIFQSFILYILSVGLYLFFDVELALAPMFIAFSSSLILFVGGNKAIKGASSLAPEEDLNQDGVADGLNEEQKKTITKIIEMMKTGKTFKVRVNNKKRSGNE
ncbi:MAG: hypothetical protein LBF97_06575 [Elusimicrobiota bacterium]|nr:hypothetical protein [Elusimicrobiota bacterium]